MNKLALTPDLCMEQLGVSRTVATLLSEGHFRDAFLAYEVENALADEEWLALLIVAQEIVAKRPTPC